MTISSVGTDTRDYSTIALWWADVPADLIGDENTWEGECYNDSEFVVNASLNLSVANVNAIYNVTLRCAAGESFNEHPDKLTNALRYNASNGVGVRALSAYSQQMVVGNYMTLEGIQLQVNSKNGPCTISGANTLYKDCILQTSGDGNSSCLQVNGSGGKAVNTVIINASSNSGRGVLLVYDYMHFYNCTIISLASANTADGIHKSGSAGNNSIFKNTTVLGFGTAFEDAFWGAGSDYNASDDTSSPGANSTDSLTFSDQFENISSITTLDLRNKTDADLVGAGIRDQANTNDLDILGQSRVVTATGQTIGATEFVSGGPTILPIYYNTLMQGDIL